MDAEPLVRHVDGPAVGGREDRQGDTSDVVPVLPHDVSWDSLSRLERVPNDASRMLTKSATRDRTLMPLLQALVEDDHALSGRRRQAVEGGSDLVEIVEYAAVGR